MAIINRPPLAEVLVPIQQDEGMLPVMEAPGCLQNIWNVVCGDGSSLAQTITSIALFSLQFSLSSIGYSRSIVGTCDGYLFAYQIWYYRRRIA